MKRKFVMHKAVASIMALTFGILSVLSGPAQAAMVSTADIVGQGDADLARQKVVLFFDRQDVQRQMNAWGVNADEARMRVAAMTDEEVIQLAGRIDQVPAGGDFFGFIVGLSIVIFVVLLITDITGVTDVFTFIKKK